MHLDLLIHPISMFVDSIFIESGVRQKTILYDLNAR